MEATVRDHESSRCVKPKCCELVYYQNCPTPNNLALSFNQYHSELFAGPFPQPKSSIKHVRNQEASADSKTSPHRWSATPLLSLSPTNTASTSTSSSSGFRQITEHFKIGYETPPNQRQEEKADELVRQTGNGTGSSWGFGQPTNGLSGLANTRPGQAGVGPSSFAQTIGASHPATPLDMS